MRLYPLPLSDTARIDAMVNSLGQSVTEIAEELVTLSDRLNELPTDWLLQSDFIERDSDPDFDEDWKEWVQYTQTDNGYSYKVWKRLSAYNDAALVIKGDVTINDDTATPLGSNAFIQAIAPFATIQYNKEKVILNGQLHNRVQLTISRGIYSNFSYRAYLDGVEVPLTNGGFVINPTDTQIDSFVRSYGGNSIRVALTPTDTTKSDVIYEFKVI